jgi:transposase
MSESKRHPAQRRYPPELKERAVRMAREVADQEGSWSGVIPRVAKRLGVGVESLRGWIKQAEMDSGHAPGMTSAESVRLAELERENRELRRANEILMAASAFFARELDPRLPR